MGLKTRKVLQEPPHQLEKQVRFSMSLCDVDSYCLKKLQKNELKKLYTRFGHLENHTWQSIRNIPRDKGISIDKKGSKMYNLLKRRVPQFSSFGHLRVNGTDTATRVFVGIERDLAFVLLIDRTGTLQH